jgi:DNA-directed RNA polymerase specialized sigma24 family protein
VNNCTDNHYIDKKELRAELIACIERDEVSEELAHMFIKIVKGVSLRFNNLSYYGITDDVQQECLLLLLQKYKNFDPERKTASGDDASVFAFLTTIVYNQIRYNLSRAKKEKERMDYMTTTVREIFKER